MEDTYLVPTTELEAVNEMLSTIGESPVSSLNSDGIFANAESALNLLRSINRRVQKQGCHFNSEKSFPLLPDTSGEVYLPANTLQADEITPQDDQNRDLVVRGRRLYDIRNNTYKIRSTVVADLVILLGFEECPECVRDYVTIRACRVFADRFLGETAVHSFTKDDERMAKAVFVRAELRSRDGNMLKNRHSAGITNRRTLLR